MRLTLLLVALGSSSVALTAHAQKDLAGCKTVTDATFKTATTPHHAYSTQTQGTKTRVSESILVNDKNYFQYQGTWRVSPMTVAEVLQLKKQNVDSATVYTCKSTGAGTYHVRTENSLGKYEGDLTVQNGLVTRVEEDVDIGAVGSKMHTSTKYDYSNVKAPPGV